MLCIPKLCEIAEFAVLHTSSSIEPWQKRAKGLQSVNNQKRPTAS
jgi:hypothetical protein